MNNEELLDALETAISKVYGHDDMPAYHKARAAVLARMCGPGEVVVPMEQIDEWRTAVQSWGAYVSDYFKDKHGFADDLATFDKYLAARPNGESK